MPSPWLLLGTVAAGLVLVSSVSGAAPAQTAADPPKAPAGIEVAVSGVTASVRQYESAVAYVTVRNPAATPFTLTGVTSAAVKGLRLCARFDHAGRADLAGTSHGECPRAIPVDVLLEPGDTLLLRWDITVPDQVAAGKQPLVFEVTFSGPGGQRTASGASSIEAAVVGQTGALDVLKVSFLFLPGFLVLTVFYLLTAIGGQPEWLKRLAPSNPEAWAVGVLLSFAAIPLYPRLSGRSYLAGYATKDLVLVWAGSVVVGVGLFLVYLGVRAVADGQLATYRARRTPAPGDSPAVVLAKLTRSRRLPGGVPAHPSLWFAQTRVRQGAGTIQVFKLADGPSQPPPQGPTCWIAPAIELDRALVAAGWGEVERAMAEDASAEVLHGPAAAAARWATVGALAGPELISVSALADDPQLRPRLIIQETSAQ